MHKQTHPDTEQLDRLRSGLLDDDHQLKTSLEEHLAACPDCQSRYTRWDQLYQISNRSDLKGAQLKRDLRTARQTALTSDHQARPRQLVPLAAAAALFTALSAGLLTLQYNGSGFNQAQDETQLAVQTESEVLDIYEDLDFYLWLATEEENGNTNGNHSNST